MLKIYCQKHGIDILKDSLNNIFRSLISGIGVPIIMLEIKKTLREQSLFDWSKSWQGY